VLAEEIQVPVEGLGRFLGVDDDLAVLQHLSAIGIHELRGVEHGPGPLPAHAEAVLVLVRLGEGLGGGEEVVEAPVVPGCLDPVLLQPVRPVVDAVVGHHPGKRGDLVVDGDRLPGDGQHVLVMLPLLALGGEIFQRAHALELAHPVVPDLAAIGRIAGGDGGDELLPGLRLRHEFQLHLEILLRLVEALDQ